MKKLSRFTILGFGNQAKAWAMNLRDSGVEVFIGLRKNSSSHQLCHDMGFQTFNFEVEIIPTDYFALLTPDETHIEILEIIATKNKEKSCLYAHGFSLLKSNLQKKFPNIEHVLFAPKSIASELRFSYETKKSIGIIYSLEFANKTSFETLESLSSSLGVCTLYPASFKEETEADLFSEQSILCSILPYLANETFKTLRKNGYPKELSFYECFYEVKLIADTMIKMGPQNFFDLISPNALIGSQVGKELLLDTDFKNKLETLIDNIQAGEFNKTIEQTDLAQVRSDVSKYWQQQELTDVYNSLKDNL